MEEKRKFPGVERFLLIATVLIIAMHTAPFSSVNRSLDFVLVRIVARIAIPICFMLIGYFIANGYISMRACIKKLGIWYIVANICYLPIMCYTGYFKEGYSTVKLIKDFLVNGTVYHLWVFPACILGLGIVALLKRMNKPELLLYIIGLLYLIGMLGDSYYRAVLVNPQLDRFYQLLFRIFEYTRNGLFYAPVFLYLGMNVGKKKWITPYWSLICFLVSLALMIVEGTILHALSMQRNDTMYFFLVPCVYFLFEGMIQDRRPTRLNDRICAELIYLINPMVIVMVRFFAKMVHMEQWMIENSILYFLTVTVVSVGLSKILELIGTAVHLVHNPGNSMAWVEIGEEITQESVKRKSLI